MTEDLLDDLDRQSWQQGESTTTVGVSRHSPPVGHARAFLLTGRRPNPAIQLTRKDEDVCIGHTGCERTVERVLAGVWTTPGVSGSDWPGGGSSPAVLLLTSRVQGLLLSAYPDGLVDGCAGVVWAGVTVSAFTIDCRSGVGRRSQVELGPRELDEVRSAGDHGQRRAPTKTQTYRHCIKASTMQNEPSGIQPEAVDLFCPDLASASEVSELVRRFDFPARARLVRS